MKIEITDIYELEGLLNLFNEAIKSAEGLPDKKYSLKEFSAQTAGEEILVANINEKNVGFVSVWCKDKFVHHLYVAPKYQRRNVGKALLQECQIRYGLPLSLKCPEANKEACSFYERNGWVIKSRDVDDAGPYIPYWLKNA